MKLCSLSAIISSRGQVQIPAKIRKAIGAQTGDLVIFRMLDDGTILMKIVKRKRLSELYGSLKSSVKFSSLEDETENTEKMWTAKRESERMKRCKNSGLMQTSS
jgi:antitoxin PrlF